jgi:hypothetical protein
VKRGSVFFLGLYLGAAAVSIGDACDTHDPHLLYFTAAYAVMFVIFAAVEFGRHEGMREAAK